MRFSTYTLVITYFMAGLGFWAVGLVDSIERPFLLLTGAAASVSFFFNLKKRALIRGYLWNILAGAVLVFFMADYVAVSRSLIVSASRFLTVLLALKLYDIGRARDLLLVYSLVFFQILAAAASTVSPVFLLILSLFVIGGIWAMTVLNIKRDFQREFPGNEDVPMVFGMGFFLSIMAVSVLSLFITFAIFFIMPRIGVGFFEGKTLNTVKVTGFSDKVDLGAIGPVKKDPTVVMRVEVKRRPGGAPLYFRGTALESYDGTSWIKKLRAPRLIRRRESNVFIMGRGRPEGELIEQNILLEPLETEVIFAASHAVMIEGNFPGIRTDGSGSATLSSPPYSRISYKAWSSPSPIKEPEGAVQAAYLENRYLDSTPEGRRIRSLAEKITEGAKDETQKAELIEGYLKKNYSYTLDPKKGAGDNPIADFLFYSKEGYCEHYASAMAVLLRYSGIPARVVTGFLQGEWNGLGAYYIIRQQDAHTWVEAYVRGAGWVTFDPTPPAGFVPFYRPSALSLYLDLIRWRWDRYVIHFSLADQRRFAMRLEGSASGVFRSIRSLRTSGVLKEWRGASVAVIAVAAALVLLIILKRKKSGGASGKAPYFYLKMLRELEKHGFTRMPQETAVEFAQRTGMDHVFRITEAYQKERFGLTRLESVELEDVKAAIEALGRRKKRKQTDGLPGSR